MTNNHIKFFKNIYNSNGNFNILVSKENNNIKVLHFD